MINNTYYFKRMPDTIQASLPQQMSKCPVTNIFEIVFSHKFNIMKRTSCFITTLWLLQIVTIFFDCSVRE